MATGNIQGRISITGAEHAQRQFRETSRSTEQLGTASKGMLGNLALAGTGAGAAAIAVDLLKASLDLAVQAARAAGDRGVVALWSK